MTFEQLLSIANLVVAAGVFLAITQVNISRKQLHFSTIDRCINEFRKLYENGRIQGNEINRYVDLVNEELFYFQHKYIPKVVALEWIDGMIDFIPLQKKDGSILNVGYCIGELSSGANKYLRNYQRIKTAFAIQGNYNTGIIYSDDPMLVEKRIEMRRELTNEIYKNLMRLKF